ncbi:STAS domain-containing protein [Thauera sinica]|uniref:Lipid asymmetry maintenance protein MlaB n=1 Tax=Thauera sinica TaxID=2665146 RepID=A0ABW1AXW1_9RHOO|nr:STAS domain-containing protein [Thauera sp. K11]ATE58685.1 NTP-binding protein [Thauera sp. K11]
MTSPAGNVLRLEGALTMRTVAEMLESGRRRASEGDLVVDFAAVTEADSAALALLLDWLRAARAAGHELAVRALPAGLASLAALYGVDALLPPSGARPQ